MKTLDQKRKEALIRQFEHNTLTPKQRLIKLDLRLGNTGAHREREKLADLYQKEHFSSVELKAEDKLKLEKKKSYQKPKRS